MPTDPCSCLNHISILNFAKIGSSLYGCSYYGFCFHRQLFIQNRSLDVLFITAGDHHFLTIKPGYLCVLGIEGFVSVAPRKSNRLSSAGEGGTPSKTA